MESRIVSLQTRLITGWESFHSLFAETFGFPDFYGRNMNAWIDCMTCLDDADAGMSKVTVDPGQLLVLKIDGAKDFQKRVPEIFQALIDDAAFVNRRRTDQGDPAILALLLN